MRKPGKGMGAVCLILLLLCAGCAGMEKKPSVYLDENEPEVVISLFAQGEDISNVVNDCCNNVINPKYSSKLIVFSDYADFYADEGYSYRELLQKRLESGLPDDLYIITAEDVLEIDRQGYIYDLSDLACLNNLSEDALQQSTCNGKVFSVPLSYTSFGLVWNVDMLSRYGLQIPENLDEFWSVCETLRQNGILPYGGNKDFGISVPAMCAGLGPLYQNPQSEALVGKLADGETPISTYMEDGFRFLQTMIDKEYIDVERTLATLPDSDEEIAFFAEEKCAFISSICRTKAFSHDYPFHVEMTALPVLPNGSICVVGAAQRLAVNPKSEHLEESLMIIENLCTVDTLNSFAERLGKVSPAQGNKAETLPQADRLIACMASGRQIPNQDFALHFNTWNTIKELCVRLCEGADVDELCREYDRIQQEELALYGEE
ncbi:ABC transporter substrate-binding protein [Eisenbergiella sp.]